MKIHLVTLVLVFLLIIIVEGKLWDGKKPAFSSSFPNIDPPLVGGSGKGRATEKKEQKKDKDSKPKRSDAETEKRGDPLYSPGYETFEQFNGMNPKIHPTTKIRKSDLLNGPIQPSPEDVPVPGRRVVQQGRASIFGGVAGTAVSAVNAVGQTIRNWAGNNIIGMIGKGIQAISRKFGQIKLLLFTQRHPDNGELITLENVGNTSFDRTKELIFIIHGFTHAGYYDKPEDNLISMLRIKDGFIKAGFTSNLIIVDWTTLSSDATYIFSSTSTATVADEVSDFIVGMVQRGIVPDYSWVRIVGHSLGAQTAGITGSNVIKKSLGRMVARIDGLDPAGPNFDQYTDSTLQLNSNDAAFVHVIHCNIKLMGTTKLRGTVDFYPNGGDDQSGCDAETLANSKCDAVSCSRSKRALGLDLDKHACNHVRCIDIYIESLTVEYKGCKCHSWEAFKAGACPCEMYPQPYMGYYCDETARGTYYLYAPLKSEYEKYTKNYTQFFSNYAGIVQHKMQQNNLLPEHLREAALKAQGLLPPQLPAADMSSQIPGQMPQPGQIPGQMSQPGQMPQPGQIPGQMPQPGQIPGQMPQPGQIPGQVPQMPYQQRSVPEAIPDPISDTVPEQNDTPPPEPSSEPLPLPIGVMEQLQHKLQAQLNKHS